MKCNLFETPTKENPYVDYNFLDSLFKVIAQNDYRSLPAQSSSRNYEDSLSKLEVFFC